MLKGSCACGRVRYEIRGCLYGPITFCHCWRCRKQSGSSFGTLAGLDASILKFLAGLHLMRSWQSGPGVEHYFASCCGSAIYIRDTADPATLAFPLGTLDSDPEIAEKLHLNVDTKAPWLVIADNLPQEATGPAFAARGQDTR